MAPSTLSLLATGLLAVAPVSAASCSQYAVDTSQDTYLFNHYKFIDFRAAPTLLGSLTSDISSFLTNQAFTSMWDISSWSNDYMSNVKGNVQMTTDSVSGESMLTLISQNVDGQNKVGEISTVGEQLYYASVRLGVRVSGASGACAGLFFYGDDTHETDIEILTREQDSNTSALHLTNQPHNTAVTDLSPSNSSTTSTSTSSSAGSWTDFNNYRIDWTPGRTIWWQNAEVARVSTDSVSTEPMAFMINMWSNGQDGWTGAMAPGTEARLDVQWVEIIYNTQAEGEPTVSAAGQQANGVCALGVGDGTNQQNGAVAGGATQPAPTATATASATATTATTASWPTHTGHHGGNGGNGETKAPLRFVA